MKRTISQTAFLNQILEARTEQHKGIQVSKAQVYDWVDRLVQFMFPTAVCDTSPEGVYQDWEKLQAQLQEILHRMKRFTHPTHDEKAVATFFDGLPQIYAGLVQDVETLLLFDPAAKSKEEIILAYPGFYATTAYRISHALHEVGVPLIPRIISEYAHSQTGIDIHPAAVIGSHFLIDHGTGIVIGETALIGNHVKIYQGVTLGALSVEKQDANIKRHPTIEDNVIIYAGATILGGNTVVGANSIIGGNVWLVRSVEPYSIVYNQSQVDIRQKQMEENPLNFMI